MCKLYLLQSRHFPSMAKWEHWFWVTFLWIFLLLVESRKYLVPQCFFFCVSSFSAKGPDHLLPIINLVGAIHILCYALGGGGG